jgi:hypothetical protein
LIYHALEKLARITGRTFSETEANVWAGQQNPIATLLQAELASRWKTLHGEDPAKTFASKSWCDEPEATAKKASVHCDECWQALEANCPSTFARMAANRDRRLALLEAMLEHVRCNGDGSLWGCQECGQPEFVDVDAGADAAAEQPSRSCTVYPVCGPSPP